MKKYACLALLALLGCKEIDIKPDPVPSIIITPSPTPKPSETPSSSVKQWENYKWYPEYEQVLLDWYPKMKLEKMSAYCPKWESLSNKKEVWVKLWKSTIMCESGYNLYSTYQENMGNDSVTGSVVFSEGLLQLSYQDAESYQTSECKKFDWSKDKGKNIHDKTKTIFDPILNLSCGMSIAKKHFEWGSKRPFPLQDYWACHRSTTSGPSEFKKLAPECF